MADQETNKTPVHTDAEDVRAGETPGIVRYVLLISLGLAIVLLSAIWIVPSLMMK